MGYRLQAGLPESYYNWLVGHKDGRERWAPTEHEFFVSRASIEKALLPEEQFLDVANGKQVRNFARPDRY